MNKFSERSFSELKGVNPKLICVAQLALIRCPIDFGISDGVRTMAEQRTLVSSGASLTLRSRHLTGDAIDVFAVINGKARWEMPLYSDIAKHMKWAAKDLGIPITWGGDWNGFKDGPHFELKR